MPRYISLLRGINVSGQKAVRMDELRAVYESLGLERVSTYIQSGNVVFSARSTDLGKRIEAAIRQHFGFDVPVLVRDADNIGKLLSNNPFVGEPGIDVAHLHVSFAAATLPSAVTDALSRLARGREAFHLGESEIYLYCPDGYGRSKLTNTNLEKALGQIVTTRNWKTVNRLHEMAIQD